MRSKRAQQGNDNEDRTNLLESNRSLSAPTHKFVDLLSVYGYSLAVFVPVSVSNVPVTQCKLPSDV